MAKETEVLQPCPNCGSTKFGVVYGLCVEMISEAKKGSGNILQPRFDAAICMGCNLTQMFMREGPSHLLEACDHEIIDLSSPNPYR